MAQTFRHSRSRLAGLLLAMMISTVASTGYALSDVMEADRLLLAAEDKMAAGQTDSAWQYLQRLDSLTVNLDDQAQLRFFRLAGDIALQRGELDTAKARLSAYAEEAGNEGEFYEDALRKLTTIEELQTSHQDLSGGNGGHTIQAAAKATDAAGEQFDQTIRGLYPSSSLSEALQAYVNGLLASHMWLKGDIKNLEKSDRLEYSVAVRQPANIAVTRKDIRQAGDVADYSVETLAVPGVNANVSFRCSDVSDQCVVRHPVSADPWLIVSNDRRAATDISYALSRLIKSLQR